MDDSHPSCQPIGAQDLDITLADKSVKRASQSSEVGFLKTVSDDAAASQAIASQAEVTTTPVRIIKFGPIDSEILWRHLYSWPGVFAQVFIFGVLIAATTSSLGLAYGRFHIRGTSCYHDSTFLALEDYDEKVCQGFTYPYRLRLPWWGSRLPPWILYFTHQFGQWYVLSQVQRAKGRGEVGWPSACRSSVGTEDDLGKNGCPFGVFVNKYARRMFLLNTSMIFFKFLVAQTTYDGLSNDVPEWSAQYSVILWIIFSCIMRLPSRGLVFGYIRSFPAKEGVIPDIVIFWRVWHGYIFSFGTTYNFWFHPMEGSPGFVMGYLYQFCMILQSSFLFHPMHKNRFWTTALELGVIPHAALIALFMVNQGLHMVFFFGFGFSIFGCFTHLHGLGLSKRTRAVVIILFAGLVVTSYKATGTPLFEILYLFRVGMAWLYIPVFWIIWSIGSLIVWPFRPFVKRFPPLLPAFWFGIYVAHMLAFIRLGATNAEESGSSGRPIYLGN